MPVQKAVIETHRAQHYVSSERFSNRTLEEEQEKTDRIVSMYNNGISLNEIVEKTAIKTDDVVRYIKMGASQEICIYETQKQKHVRIKEETKKCEN